MSGRLLEKGGGLPAALDVEWTALQKRVASGSVGEWTALRKRVDGGSEGEWTAL